MPPTSIDISKLLGKPIDAPEVTTALASVDPGNRVKVDRDTKELYWVSKKAGVEIQLEAEGNCISDIFLYAGGEDGFKRYTGPLPGGITFDMKQEQVKSCFSEPPVSTDPEGDIWDRGDYRIAVCYLPEGGISEVVITTEE